MTIGLSARLNGCTAIVDMLHTYHPAGRDTPSDVTVVVSYKYTIKLYPWAL